MTKSVLANLMDGKVEMAGGAALQAKYPGQVFSMGADPRLPQDAGQADADGLFQLPLRLDRAPAAKRDAGAEGRPHEKVVLACLLHDIAVVSFIRCDHGYWGAQMIEPYVDEEVSWAIRMHQALRFFPDESVGYKYPDMYGSISATTTSPSPTSSRSTSAPGTTSST